MKEAFEEAYNEKLDLESLEEIESDEPHLNELPPPGMEDEVSQTVLMPFKDFHEKSKTTSRQGRPYVKCQVCGKAMSSMSIGTFWQHVESKNQRLWSFGNRSIVERRLRKRHQESAPWRTVKLERLPRLKGPRGARNTSTATMSASGIRAKKTV